MKCPRCKTDTLQSEMYEGVEIDRCTKCDGTWLDEGELAKIVATKEKTFPHDKVVEAMTHTFDGIPVDETLSVELCPKCGKAMKAVNFEMNSGVIIDRCPNDHGVWLDAKELEKAQIFHEREETDFEAHRAEWAAYIDKYSKNKISAQSAIDRKQNGPVKYVVNSMLHKLFGI